MFKLIADLEIMTRRQCTQYHSVGKSLPKVLFYLHCDSTEKNLLFWVLFPRLLQVLFSSSIIVSVCPYHWFSKQIILTLGPKVFGQRLWLKIAAFWSFAEAAVRSSELPFGELTCRSVVDFKVVIVQLIAPFLVRTLHVERRQLSGVFSLVQNFLIKVV